MTVTESMYRAMPKRILVVVHEPTADPSHLRSMFHECKHHFDQVHQHQFNLDDINDLLTVMHNVAHTSNQGSFIVFELQLENTNTIRYLQKYTMEQLPQVTIATKSLLGSYVN